MIIILLMITLRKLVYSKDLGEVFQTNLLLPSNVDYICPKVL